MPRELHMDARLRSDAWSAVQVGTITAVVGALGLLARQPWLFPSLGPTAVLQARMPWPSEARPWNAVVGHALAVACGCASVLAVGAQHAPGVFVSGQLTAARVVAAVLAASLTAVATKALRAPHPPATSTTLLFAEGSYRPTTHDIVIVGAGVALTVALACVFRRLRCAHASVPSRDSALPVDTPH